jgi:hypothetical protein
VGIEFIVRHDTHYRTGLLVLLLTGPLLAGCAGVGGDMFSSDLLSKDADWFSRSGRVFIKNVSIDSPPLTPDRPVAPDDLITADGMCPGMAQPGAVDANALADGAAGGPAASRPGVVALGHTECDVARGNGAPDSVNLSTNPRGDRVAVLTYSRGARPGIYTFTAGRLTVVERGPEPLQQPKAARPKAKKRAAT